MNPHQPESPSATAARSPSLNLVRTLLGSPDDSAGEPRDAGRAPPGRWDTVVRAAARRLKARGPSPEPWHVVRAFVGGHRGGHSGEERWLNPRLLPPRYSFLLALADAFIARAELIQEAALALRDEPDQRGADPVSAYVARFTTDLCGTEFKLAHPFPWPPGPAFAPSLDGLDLLVLAVPFEQAAERAFDRDLARDLAGASARFVEAGLARLR